MVRSVAVSGLVGGFAAVAAWVAAVMLLGTDGQLLVQGHTIEWPAAIGVMSLVLVIGMVMALHRLVEPMLTALATAAGCALLYNTRELPVSNANLQQSSDNYWVVIVAMVMILAVLMIGLRVNRPER